MTKQRKIIKDIIYAPYKHPTAEEIYELAKKKMPSIAVGTVYRNLNLLSETGQILKISLEDDSAHFAHHDACHVHFVHVYYLYRRNVDCEHGCVGCDRRSGGRAAYA